MLKEYMAKIAFTINQFRTKEEIESFGQLLANNLYQGIEIFYPYSRDKNGYDEYTVAITKLLIFNPEVVLHLPFGAKNNLLDDRDGNILRRLKDAIDYGKSLRATKFTLHLGESFGRRDDAIERLVYLVKDLCKYAGDSFIMIENMPSSRELGYSPKEIKYIIERSNCFNLKFILDTGHANVSEYLIDDYLFELREELMHVHINDNNGLRDEHVRIGLGDIDFKKFIANNKDYKNLYCLEIIYKDKDDLVLYANDLNKFF